MKTPFLMVVLLGLLSSMALVQLKTDPKIQEAFGMLGSTNVFKKPVLIKIDAARKRIAVYRAQDPMSSDRAEKLGSKLATFNIDGGEASVTITRSASVGDFGGEATAQGALCDYICLHLPKLTSYTSGLRKVSGGWHAVVWPEDSAPDSDRRFAIKKKGNLLHVSQLPN